MHTHTSPPALCSHSVKAQDDLDCTGRMKPQAIGVPLWPACSLNTLVVVGAPATHRGSSVEVVVFHVPGLRHDRFVNLQDSSAHVQDASGPVVQAVLETQAEARATVTWVSTVLPHCSAGQ